MFSAVGQTWLWKALASVRLTMVLLPLIISACIAGSLFEQDRANSLVYHSPWFNGLIALLGLNTLVCMLSRTSLRWSQATFIVNHISLLIIMAGAVVGGIWGFRGAMQVFEGQSSRTVWVGMEKKELDFSVFLKDFEVVWGGADNATHRLSVTQPGKEPVVVEVTPVPGTRVAAGDATLVVQAYYPDFFIDGKQPGTRSLDPKNPALYLTVETPSGSWPCRLFAKFPEFGDSEHQGPNGPVKVAYEIDESGGTGMYVDQYQSDVSILDADGKPVLDTRILVNSPLRHGGYTFYQSGYDEEAGRYSVFQVSRDPGVPLVYAGFGLLSLGLLVKYFIEKPLQAGAAGAAPAGGGMTAGALMDRFQAQASQAPPPGEPSARP